MANSRIPDLTNYTTPDGTNDTIPIWDNANSQTKKITRNNYLGITGNPVGHTDTQTLSNKTLGNTNTVTLKDTLFTLQDDGDATKQAQFQLSGITTGNTRTYTLPNATGTLVDLNTSQTLTNKTLTAPIISGGSIDNSTVTVDSVAGHTSANTGTIFGISVTSSIFPQTALPLGAVVQVQSTNFSAVATGTTLIPFDDTMPQNTEGDQYMTQAITPKSATNHLSIEALSMTASSVSNHHIIALFQDSTASALATDAHYQVTNAGAAILKLHHDMVAGTTSATTFKIRLGQESAGTLTFNGVGGARKFGGITLSSIKITEYKA